jgi:hypothetical protein
LEKIAGTKRTETNSRKREEDSVKKVTDANKKAAQAADELTDKLDGLVNQTEADERRKRVQGYRDQQHMRTVEDLRSKMSRLERATPAGAFESLTNGLAVFGGRLADSDSKLKGLGGTVQKLGRALAVASFGPNKVKPSHNCPCPSGYPLLISRRWCRLRRYQH